jgi:hypothetical protein
MIKPGLIVESAMFWSNDQLGPLNIVMQRAIESKVTYLLDSRHRFDAKSEHSVLSRMSGP